MVGLTGNCAESLNRHPLRRLHHMFLRSCCIHDAQGHECRTAQACMVTYHAANFAETHETNACHATSWII